MKIKICNSCDKFQCRLIDKRSYVGDGFSVRNFLIVVLCKEKIICVEPVGKAQILTDQFASAVSREKYITSNMLPDSMKDDYSDALDNVIRKLVDNKNLEECECLPEQLMSEWYGKKK